MTYPWKIQLLRQGGFESPLFITESGFIPQGATRVPEGLMVMPKTTSSNADAVSGASPIVISDGTCFLGMLINGVRTPISLHTPGYVYGSREMAEWGPGYDRREGDTVAVFLGPGQVVISKDVYAGSPGNGDTMYVTTEGKLTPTYNATASATEGNIKAAICLSDPVADDNGFIRILILAPAASGS